MLFRARQMPRAAPGIIARADASSRARLIQEDYRPAERSPKRDRNRKNKACRFTLGKTGAFCLMTQSTFSVFCVTSAGEISVLKFNLLTFLLCAVAWYYRDYYNNRSYACKRIN